MKKSPVPGATSLMATSQTQFPKLDSKAVPRKTGNPPNEKNTNTKDAKSRLEMSKKTSGVESAKKVEKQQQQITNNTNIKSKNFTEGSPPPSPCNGMQKQPISIGGKNKQSAAPEGAVELASNTTDIASNSNNVISIKNECDQSIVIKSEETVQIINNKDDENQNSISSNENRMFAKPHPLLLSSVNPHVVCNLCFGYLIDATTIVECLHSFCHSCLIKHLRTEQYCPRCEMMINTAKPNIKPDTTLQAIVYKLVPGLYERELMRKRAFYKDRPSHAALATPEQRGEDTEHLIFSPSDYMSLSLEYADKDEHINSNAEYTELLKPRYLQCPSMYTISHLKKFVHGKFEIDANKFNIDIMYKVKTIVLLDHYTLMDVAYIYTWKRDAPMRFYFRVKESLRPIVKVRKTMPTVAKRQTQIRSKIDEPTKLPQNAMTVIHEPSPSIKLDIAAEMLPITEIKVEHEADCNTITPNIAEEKCFEIVPQAESTGNGSCLKDDQSNTDKLKITLVSKSSKERQLNAEHKSHSQSRSSKEKRDSLNSSVSEHKDERKVENIKLKIDLSKQNSVTIINMSDPHRKEIVKPVKPEKEWKVKVKKEKSNSPKSSPNSERKSKTPSPLTVPPLTIKAERISPLAKLSSNLTSVSPKAKAPPLVNSEDEEKSQFLKSFALTPIKAIKLESPERPKSFIVSSSLTNVKAPVAIKKETMKAPQSSVLFKTPAPSKRKSKEPVKAIVKRPKMSPPLPPSDFKIKLSPSPISALTSTATPAAAASKSTTLCDKPLMPPPAPVSVMKPPIGIPKKATQKMSHKFAAPGSLTPHPMQGIQMAAPGNRTPIAKRYQPILPKGARPNPFANIPSGVNKILKDAGTEIKSIGNESNISKVYGPKTDSSSSMGPPQPQTSNQKTPQPSPGRGNASPNTSRSANANKQNNTNNYLNLALFNASKSKGNEAPPGCRTPMYTPNSPIYSPSSPQYVPNYNIPIMPTYKYTPKPNNASSSYLQNVLGSNSQMASLFPAPPTKKDTSSTQSTQKSAMKTDVQLKRAYPFTRSPSPVEDPPEKQLKVKSLLNSCNINIPSSLSITITREDSESQSNNASYPKHKSPVNNYIEILKLPDQPAENTENNKRSSPPAVQKTNLPSTKTDSSDIKRTPSPQHLVPQKAVTPSTQNVKHKQQQQQTNGTTINKSPVSIHAINVATSIAKPTTPPSSNAMTINSTANSNSESSTTTSSATTHQKPLQPTVTKSYNNQKSNQPNTQVDKKTPSPEKRSSQAGANEHSSSSSGGETNKSPKSPNTSSDASAKKFRHILPRQNPTPIPEVIPAKVTTASIIGTYSSPSGIAVKIHANKKVPPTKKSPNSQTQPQQQLPNKSPQGQIASQTTTNNNNNNSSSLKVTSSLKSPPAASQKPPFSNNNNINKVTTKTATLSPPVSSPNAINNKLVPHSNLSTLSNLPPHSAMQAMAGLTNIPPHLAAAAAATSAAGQAELTKFFKDNLLRAHVQAAAASQSNMFYPYAANAAAAQMGQYTPSMYNNYQQAYIMEQLSRMHRAGNEAITEYMQKLKNGIDSKPTTNPLDGNSDSRPKVSPMSLSSPKSSSQPPPPSPNSTTSKGHNTTASKGK